MLRWPAEAVWEQVVPQLPGFTVEVLSQVDSTNSELMRRARAGDMAPVLLSLSADVVASSVRGERTIPLHAFFAGYRKTVLERDEIVSKIVIPRGPSGGARRIAASYKVSKRREMDVMKL